jgi:hypothetical protein
MTIESNIAGRRAAADLVCTTISLLKDSIRSLPSDRSRQDFFRLMAEGFAGKMDPPHKVVPVDAVKTVKKPDKQQASANTANQDTDLDEAAELIEEIKELCEEICSAGRDFADSVLEKTESIEESITDRGSVTSGQLEALENMRDGLARWFR